MTPKIEALKPIGGWTWGTVEDVIYAGLYATERLPDRENRFLTAGSRVNWPEIKRDFGDHTGAVGNKKDDNKRTDGCSRYHISDKDIDQIDPAFDLMAIIPERDLKFFGAVMCSKVSRAGNVDWLDVRARLGLPRGMQTGTIYKRYQRVLARLADKLNGGENYD